MKNFFLKTINNYAHDYRDIKMTEESLKTMLINFKNEFLDEIEICEECEENPFHNWNNCQCKKKYCHHNKKLK